MSERLIDIADDLFHHRIPSVWAGLCGDSAPPPNWTLAQWMSDLSHRCQHLERIIVQVIHWGSHMSLMYKVSIDCIEIARLSFLYYLGILVMLVGIHTFGTIHAHVKMYIY